MDLRHLQYFIAVAEFKRPIHNDTVRFFDCRAHRRPVSER